MKGNKVNCDNCGKIVQKSPSKVKGINFCDGTCRHNYYHTLINCTTCGKEKKIRKGALSENNFCSFDCFRKFASKRMSKMNTDLNPERMTLETRKALRKARLAMNLGENKAYKKYLGRHLHRVVAEKKIGRSLKPGEIVHHKDENKLNNSPDNLKVLPNQAEHARIHAIEEWKEGGIFRNRKPGKKKC